MANAEKIDEQHEAHVILRWFKSRLIKAKQKDSKFTLVSGYLVAFILILEIFFVVPGISTGLGIVIDYILVTLIYIICIYLAKTVLTFILKFFYIKHFSFLIVSTIALFIQSYLITKQIDWNTYSALLFSTLVTSIAVLFSSTVTYLWLNSRRWTWSVIILYLAVIAASAFLIKIEQLQQTEPVTEPEILHEILVEQQHEYDYLPVPLTNNPAEHGEYAYKHIEYSSSSEQEIAEKLYDEDDELTSIRFPSVDGSDILQDWSWSKEMYWGFSEQDIAISGDLWIPEGEGPFPIVYIMHGNHISETDSSVGYTYLAELFASNGYIVSSIDANFLNFSVWSGIVDNDMLLRAWLYLAQIDTFFNADILPIDWNNVALIGHSRGGQAAAMAVDIEKWIEEDEVSSIINKVNINAVVGIAPTDYAVDGKLPYLKNINYLTIQGTLDSDLTEFFGERQFERTQLKNELFKASVVIYGANHGQFNETWGKYDDQFPAALLLNTEQLIDEASQQLAAKVYINGFLKAVFEDKQEYRQLFQDSRVASSFLPVAGYVTQYEDNNMDYYYTFDSEHKIEDISSSAKVKFEAVELKGRNGSTKYNDVLSVKWDIGYSKLYFPIKAGQINKRGKEIEAYVFQIAKNTPSAKVEQMTNMNMELDFITTSSISRINLNKSFILLDPYIPTYLKLDFLEDEIKQGKYEKKEEPYLQTYIIPVDIIKEHMIDQGSWNSDELIGIQFWFKDKTGSIMIDDIGVIYEEGGYVKYE